jgi:hypothetical protein
MIRCLIALPAAVLIGASLVWVATLAGSADPDRLLGRRAGDLAAAVHDDGVRGGVLTRAASTGSRLHARLPQLPGGTSAVLAAGLTATALQADLASLVLPFGLALALVGVAAGTLLRERLRFGAGYASPTAAYLARYLAGAGLLYAGLWALSPLPLTSATLYLAWLVVSVGSALYAANLPIRI